MPKAFTLGLAVSIVSLAIFILIIIFEKYVFALIFGKRGKTIGVDTERIEGKEEKADEEFTADCLPGQPFQSESESETVGEKDNELGEN